MFLIVLSNHPLQAQAVFNEIEYDVEFYMASDGDDSNDGLEPGSAMRSFHYTLKAAEPHLVEGRSVRINVTTGEYIPIGNNGALRGEEHESRLCIEGDAANPPVFDGSDYKAGRGYLDAGYAQNVIIRNIRFKNFISRPPISIGHNLKLFDIRNILIENIEAVNGTSGMQIKSGARNITIRNCKFNNNLEEGAFLFIQDTLIEDCEFNGNWK